MGVLVSYWKKQKTAIKLLLRIPRKKFSKGKIHLLRVELKKLNALLLMTEFQKKEFNRKKFYKPFRRLFSLAGKVRELQIEKGILKKFKVEEKIPGFLKSLDQKIDTAKKKFFKRRNRKLNSKIEKRLKRLNPTIRNLEKTNLPNYLNNLILEIKLILPSGQLEERNGHLLRKKLQTLKYNIESLQSPKTTLPNPAPEELLKLLGSWHDLVKVNELLKLELGSMHNRPGEILGIQQIRQKITNSNTELIQEINLKIPLIDDLILPLSLRT